VNISIAFYLCFRTVCNKCQFGLTKLTKNAFDIGHRTKMSNFGNFFKENPHFNRLEIWDTYLLRLDVHFKKIQLPYVKKCRSGRGPKLVKTHFLAKSDHFGPLLKIVAVELRDSPSHYTQAHT